MSGIVGIINFDGEPVEQELLQKMTDTLALRGPDRTGLWINGNIGFGHTLLAATPEHQREKQPCTIDGQVWIVADARIDDRTHLKNKLRAKGHLNVDTATDVELILYSYYAWEENCVDHLLGDFSFAIWDKNKNKLFCARDHMGVKPFVYYRRGDLFIFASEVQAIIAYPDVPRKVNEARIVEYLVEMPAIETQSTVFQDILRLSPANYLLVNSEKQLTRRYWNPDAFAEIHYGSDEQYGEAFLDVFSKAVICRLRSPGLVGSMLSGGLDSSSIVGIARDWMKQNNHSRLHTFSAIAEDEDNDTETHFIKSMLAQGHVVPITVKPSEIFSIQTEIEQLLSHKDYMFGQYQSLPQLMYILAAKHNMRAILTGLDGDVVASNHPNYISFLIRAGKWRTAWEEANGLSKFYARWNKSALHYLLQYGRFSLPDFIRTTRYTHTKEHYLQSILDSSIINPDFARRNNLGERLLELKRLILPPGTTSIRQLNAYHLRLPNNARALERYDRMASLYSIETRHPLMDKRVIEFSLSLPWNLRVRTGWTKFIMRKALSGILPEEVLWRRGWEHIGSDFTEAWYKLQKRQTQTIVSKIISESQYESTSIRDSLQQYLRFDRIQTDATRWQVYALYFWMKIIQS